MEISGVYALRPNCQSSAFIEMKVTKQLQAQRPCEARVSDESGDMSGHRRAARFEFVRTMNG